jgi:hypothetical protein
MSEVSLYRRQRSRGIGPHLMQACYQSIHISLFDASVSSVHEPFLTAPTTWGPHSVPPAPPKLCICSRSHCAGTRVLARSHVSGRRNCVPLESLPGTQAKLRDYRCPSPPPPQHASSVGIWVLWAPKGVAQSECIYFVRLI